MAELRKSVLGKCPNCGQIVRIPLEEEKKTLTLKNPDCGGLLLPNCLTYTNLETQDSRIREERRKRMNRILNTPISFGYSSLEALEGKHRNQTRKTQAEKDQKAGFL